MTELRQPFTKPPTQTNLLARSNLWYNIQASRLLDIEFALRAIWKILNWSGKMRFAIWPQFT